MIQKIIKAFQKDEITSYAAQISFFIIISLIPLFSLLLIIFNIFSTDSTKIFSFLLTSLPSNISTLINILLKKLSQEASIGFNIFNILLLFWSSSKAVDNMIMALNKITSKNYKINFLQKKIKSFILILILSFGLLSSFILLFFRNTFFTLFFPNNQFLYLVSNYAINLILLLGSVSLVYYFAPTKKESYLKIIPGSIFFTISWIILVSTFTWITSIFWSSVMGSISTIFATIMFIYFSSILLLLGAKINQN